MTGITLVTALTAASAAVGVVGTLQAARANADASEYNAKIQERDAIVADQNRKATLEMSRIAADDKRRENRRTMSAIRASYGSSGLDLAGSPLDVLEDSAVESELDATRVEYEGRVRGREGALQMLGLQEGSKLSRMEAKNYKKAGGIAAIGAGLSGEGRTLERTN